MHQHATIPIEKMGGFSISMSTSSEKREISSQNVAENRPEKTLEVEKNTPSVVD